MDDGSYERIIFLADPELNEPVLVYALEGWIDAGVLTTRLTSSTTGPAPPLLASAKIRRAPGPLAAPVEVVNW